MNYIAKKLDMLKAVAVVTYKEWFAYRTHSMVSIFVGPVYFIVQYFIWTAVYTGREDINGMTLENMLVYFGVSALTGYLTMDFADWNLQMLISTGKFLTFLMRPLHHRFFALSQKVGHRILGLFFEFIPTYLIFLFVFRIRLIPASLFWWPCSVVLSFFMTFYINYCIGLTGFYFTRTNGIRSVMGVLKSIFSGSLIPLVFFPEIFQKILLILPFQYMTYVPAMVFTGKYNLAGMELSLPVIVGLQLIVVIMWGGFSEIFYRISIKRFQGVGG